MSFEDNDSVTQILALPVIAFVQVVYKKILDRSPDPQELKSNAGALRCGLGRVHFLANIYKSQEFRCRFQQVIGEGSDNAFVARIFAMYLGRTPDPQGLAHYLMLLQSGQSRELVRRDIAKSKEARRSYTFWYEFERLISDHHNSLHPIKRWFGKSRRDKRQKNRDFEIITSLPVFGIDNYAPRKADISCNIEGNSSAHYMQQVSLTKVDDKSLNLRSRRILSRLQHASGISSPNRNHG